jgi:hypothetical protein
MRNIYTVNKRVAFFGIVAALVLTSCASLFNGVPTPKTGTFTQQELNEFRRIRNDPRMYGIRLDSEQYARYLKVTGQELE